MEITAYTLIDLFCATKQTEGKSPKSISWYKSNLTRFADFASNGAEATLPELNLHTARAFVASLQEKKVKYDDNPLRPQENQGLSPSTIHGYVRTLKTFGSWLVEEGFSGTNPYKRLKAPKVPQTMIEVLSEGELGQLLKAINPTCFLGSRLYVIVLLLLDTGIRASELCGLTLENTFVNDGYIKVFGKGGKERIVPFGNTTKKALIRYLHTFRPEPEDDWVGNLVLSTTGRALTTTGLYKAIERLGKRAGVPRVHPHLFRHTFAVRYLMNGGDLMTLKLMLGHSTLEVTQMYLHLAQSHIEVQHHKFSPVDRLISRHKVH